MLAKIDIKSTFRLLPVHRTNQHLLTMKCKEYIYINECIPFTLRSAPKLFNILADILLWIAQKRGVSYVIHYLDDFLTTEPPLSHVCQQNLNTFIGLCSKLGVPFAPNKVEGSSATLTFLGIILDASVWKSGYHRKSLMQIQVKLEHG